MRRSLIALALAALLTSPAAGQISPYAAGPTNQSGLALIAPTAPANDNGDRIANTAFVTGAVSSKLPAPTPTRAGDIIYWNGSAWVTLAGNNSGTQILQENSSGVPSWVAAAAGVTQVTCGTGLSGGVITTTGNCAVNYAVKSDQQTGTSTILAVNPARQQDHDSAAKAWATWTGSTGALTSSYNVSSVTRSSAGVYVVNFTTAFSSANYSCLLGTNASGQLFTTIAANTYTTSSVTAAYFIGSTATDPSIGGSIHCFGRQ